MLQNVKVFQSADELSASLAELLVRDIERVSHQDYYSIALSGGTTPKHFFKFLALNYLEKIDWEKLLIFWVDERCVAPDNSESNYGMTYENLLVNVPVPQINIFRIKGEEAPSTEAASYSDLVTSNISEYNGSPQFDMMLLGLGSDGHTASIFPGNIDLFRSHRLYEVTVKPGSHQKRITATGRLINNSRTLVFMVTGEEKAEMVSMILNKKEGFENCPASKVNPVSGQLIWMLDTNAAKLLK